MRRFILVFSVAMVLGFAGSSGATLNNRGGGMIYDSGLDITWYDFTYQSTGWDDARIWADGLSLIVNGVTYADWRLPTTVDGPYVFGWNGTTTGGYNIISSEMGHLFYSELGNKGYYATDGTNPQPGWGLTNTGPFANLQFRSYWSGTEYGSDLVPVSAWDFSFITGWQFNPSKGLDFGALAVRSGDVGAPVPVPGTILLLGSGLAGLIGLRKGKGRRHPG